MNNVIHKNCSISLSQCRGQQLWNKCI